MANPLRHTKDQKTTDRQVEIYRNLIRREAKIGGELFGSVQPGGRREFFCLDKNTWIWHEEWTDKQSKQHHTVTTRYDVRPNGIIKAQDGQSNQRHIDKVEARNLYHAVDLYNQRVNAEIYGALA
jgi:hypothetical protein